MRRDIVAQLLALTDTLSQGVGYAVNAPAGEAAALFADAAEGILVLDQVLSAALPPHRFPRFQRALQSLNDSLEAAVQALVDGAPAAPFHRDFEAHLGALREALAGEEGRLEVLFMPYKASMWDALESVWRAAMEDARCDVFVMPLPYFERDAHGNWAERYEGGLLPPVVAVTPYEAYSLAEHRPDIVYIHNVYDGNNFITSLPEAYHTANVKPYTGSLVYIPYYVTGSPMDSAFYTQPGLHHVDVIVASTEEDRRLFEANNPRKRVLALGSPKIDSILYMEQHPPPIPAQWAQQAAGRQVVLYNTTINQLLLFGETELIKIRQVIGLLRKRSDAILLWRPHPLSRASLKAMRPELYHAYVALEEAFVADGDGIFDDSSDYHAAFHLSDLYFGDDSSLVSLYLFTGKPVLRQACGMGWASPPAVCFARGTVVDGEAWFAWEDANGLFRLPAGGGTCEFMGAFEPYPAYAPKLYGAAARVGDTLVFAPNSANHVALYSMRDRSFQACPIPFTARGPRRHYQFCAAVPHAGSVFFPGARFPGVLELDLKTRAFRLHDGWLHSDTLAHLREGDYFFADSYCLDGNCLLTPFLSAPALLEFDLSTGAGTVVPLAGCSGGFRGIVSDGESYWLFPWQDGPIVNWSRAGGVLQTVASRPAHVPTLGGFLYTACCFAGGSVWAFPSLVYPWQLTRIDPTTGAAEFLTLPELAHKQLAVVAAEADRILVSDVYGGGGYAIHLEDTCRVAPYPCFLPAGFPGAAAEEEAVRHYPLHGQGDGAAAGYAPLETPCFANLPAWLDHPAAVRENGAAQLATALAAFPASDVPYGQAIHRQIIADRQARQATDA